MIQCDDDLARPRFGPTAILYFIIKVQYSLWYNAYLSCSSYIPINNIDHHHCSAVLFIDLDVHHVQELAWLPANGADPIGI